MGEMTAKELVLLSRTLRGEKIRKSRGKRTPLEQDMARVRPILKCVAQINCITIERLLAPSREQHVSFARQMAMYLARELTDLSFPVLGDVFQRNHSTVIYGWRRIRDRASVSDAFAARLLRLLSDLAPNHEAAA